VNLLSGGIGNSTAQSSLLRRTFQTPSRPHPGATDESRLDALVVHLRNPPLHRRRWRSTNLLERSLGEVRRRTKVMGRFPGETSCPVPDEPTRLG